MKIGVVGSSYKENEKRLPLYPEHFPFISENVKSFLRLEKGYGENFGYSDKQMDIARGSFLSREELFNECDIIILPKPTVKDLSKMHKNQVLWGWTHCVQQHDIAQIAIDKELTLVSWESMHHWHNGRKELHIFQKNNEIAGYASVLHTLQLLGLDGYYGPRRRVVIISYGSVSKGAIFALHSRGFNNIHVYTRRPVHLVADQNPDVYYYHLYLKGGEYYSAPPIGKAKKFIDEIADSDIILNGILQDPLHPIVFVKNDEIKLLKKNTVIIDVSCDEGMAFEFAVPTTFKDPLIRLENNVSYYSVDHAPSYLWNAASREISKALIPFINDFVENGFDFHKDVTLSKAIEIENGNIRNKEIIKFQKRNEAYPYSYL